MQFLTIGQLAEKAGVSVETIRFYEREGLIAEPARRLSSRYRQYPLESVSHVGFIRRAKELGFKLKEIQELLELRVDAGSSRADVRKRARNKIVDLDRRIESLEWMKEALERMARHCRGNGPASTCPILDELEREPGGSRPAKRERRAP